MQHPKYTNPKSKIQNIKSKIRIPKSKIQNPKSKVHNPKSKNPKIQNTQIQKPQPKAASRHHRVTQHPVLDTSVKTRGSLEVFRTVPEVFRSEVGTEVFRSGAKLEQFGHSSEHFRTKCSWWGGARMFRHEWITPDVCPFMPHDA